MPIRDRGVRSPAMQRAAAACQRVYSGPVGPIARRLPHVVSFPFAPSNCFAVWNCVCALAFRTDGWWTYEMCHDKRLRQMHTSTVSNGKAQKQVKLLIPTYKQGICFPHASACSYAHQYTLTQTLASTGNHSRIYSWEFSRLDK